MPVKPIDVSTLLLLMPSVPIIDVRSPSEFEHAHIPGAFNLPLFDDNERKIVGTDYKQQSRQIAIKSGLKFFGPKMVSMVEKVEQLWADHSKNIKERPGYNPDLNNAVIVHCWRGGMRSAGVSWLLDLYGFKVFVVKGGYKSYRQWCHRQFEQPHHLKIIGGYTGSGKTDLIKLLKKQGRTAIDLEGIANHKGSSFGSIGMPIQPSQEMFENLLALELRNIYARANVGYEMPDDDSSQLLLPGKGVEENNAGITIWLEDESQRIGNVNIPAEFYKQMRASTVYFLEIPFEERLEYLIKDYGKGDKEKILNAIIRIKKRLGGLETKTAVNYLLEDNLKECFRVLLTYYDKYYLKGLQNREDWQNKVVNISCPAVHAVENLKSLLNEAMPS